MLVKLDCSECGERTYPEATIDTDDLLFTIPPCKKCLKDQAERMIEKLRMEEKHQPLMIVESAIFIIEKEAGI